MKNISHSQQIKHAQLDLLCNHPTVLTQIPQTMVLFVKMRMEYGRVMRSRCVTQLTVTNGRKKPNCASYACVGEVP